jgi:DNA adenine methylase
MSYPGSKAQAGVFQRIIGQMPPHSVYVEPFFGSGQVFWRKRRAESSILIDRSRASIARIGAEAGVNAICADALQCLPALIPALPADAVIYCDPPYLLSTRRGRVYYTYEMSDHHHESLLALLQEARCRVLVSGYPSAIYSSALQTWRCITYRTRTRGRTVTECLWCNYPEPDELHDWRYAGQNFRQRLYLKRLAARWLSKLKRMQPRKRGYVLHAIQEAAPDLALRTVAPEPALKDLASDPPLWAPGEGTRPALITVL